MSMTSPESLKGGHYKHMSPEEKIKDIEKKLRELKEKRQQLDANKEAAPHKKAPPIDYSKPLKKFFHHPNLEYIYGEIVHSPYMTKPLDPYPEKTLTLAGELYEKKILGIKFLDIPPDQRPYDLKKTRNQFIREVVNFQPSLAHRPTEPKKQEKRTLSPIGTPSSFFDNNFKNAQDDDSLHTAPGFTTAMPPSASNASSTPGSESVLKKAKVQGPAAKYRRQIQEQKKKMESRTTPSPLSADDVAVKDKAFVTDNSSSISTEGSGVERRVASSSSAGGVRPPRDALKTKIRSSQSPPTRQQPKQQQQQQHPSAASLPTAGEAPAVGKNLTSQSLPALHPIKKPTEASQNKGSKDSSSSKPAAPATSSSSKPKPQPAAQTKPASCPPQASRATGSQNQEQQAPRGEKEPVATTAAAAKTAEPSKKAAVVAAPKPDTKPKPSTDPKKNSEAPKKSDTKEPVAVKEVSDEINKPSTKRVQIVAEPVTLEDSIQNLLTIPVPPPLEETIAVTAAPPPQPKIVQEESNEEEAYEDDDFEASPSKPTTAGGWEVTPILDDSDRYSALTEKPIQSELSQVKEEGREEQPKVEDKAEAQVTEEYEEEGFAEDENSMKAPDKPDNAVSEAPVVIETTSPSPPAIVTPTILTEPINQSEQNVGESGGGDEEDEYGDDDFEKTNTSFEILSKLNNEQIAQAAEEKEIPSHSDAVASPAASPPYGDSQQASEVVTSAREENEEDYGDEDFEL